MDETHTDARIFLRKVMRHVLRTVDRSVLTAGAAEADHQAIEPTLHISLHMRIHNTICMLQEAEYLTVILKESDHRLITSGQFLVRLISSRIMNRPAVEHISAAVSCRIIRNSLLERETIHLDFKHIIGRKFLKTRKSAHLT